MLVWNATEDHIRAACRETGLRIHGEWDNRRDYTLPNRGRALSFRLNVDTTADRDQDGYLPYQRRSTGRWHDEKPRKIAAVCWHGHRDFMRALFRLAPDARIKTALADYRGADDFERKYPDTFGSGNEYNLSYGQACNCPDHVRLAA